MTNGIKISQPQELFVNLDVVSRLSCFSNGFLAVNFGFPKIVNLKQMLEWMEKYNAIEST